MTILIVTIIRILLNFCNNFMSCIFMPRYLVRHLHVLHIQHPPHQLHSEAMICIGNGSYWAGQPAHF